VPHRVGSLAALVRDVDAAPGHDLLDQRGDLVGRAPAAGRVLEAGGEAPCAFLHALAHERTHALDFLRGRGPAEVLAHDLAAHGAVADEQDGVGPDAAPLDALALLADRPGRAAVLVDDDRRDALRDEVRRRAAARVRVAQPAALAAAVVRVRVNVDEAGRDDLAARVDRARGARARRGEPADRGDPPVADADVRVEPRVARAVQHAPAGDEDVEARVLVRGVRLLRVRVSVGGAEQQGEGEGGGEGAEHAASSGILSGCCGQNTGWGVVWGRGCAGLPGFIGFGPGARGRFAG